MSYKWLRWSDLSQFYLSILKSGCQCLSCINKFRFSLNIHGRHMLSIISASNSIFQIFVLLVMNIQHLLTLFYIQFKPSWKCLRNKFPKTWIVFHKRKKMRDELFNDQQQLDLSISMRVSHWKLNLNGDEKYLLLSFRPQAVLPLIIDPEGPNMIKQSCLSILWVNTSVCHTSMSINLNILPVITWVWTK